MFNYLSNEKGAALLYVLMIAMVLAIFTPVMLNVISSDNLIDNKRKSDKQVTDLAVGGMEALVSYYNNYTGSDRLANFNAYPGFTGNTPKNIKTPDGTTISYKLYVVDVDPLTNADTPSASQPNPSSPLPEGNYTVKMIAEANGLSKSLRYKFPVFNSGSGGSTVDDQVNETNNDLLNMNTDKGTTSNHMILAQDYPGGATAYQNDFNSLIPTDTDFNKIYTSASTFLSDVAGYVSSHNAVSPYDTITIKCACTGDVIINSDLILSSTKKVLIYFELVDPATSQDPNTTITSKLGIAMDKTFKLNGMVIIRGDLELDNKAVL
ncbi:MAG: hypothetical protein K0S39_5378, partial [Paenibacillus sp.]|nr:hypothetical protein [Paenibacillus sp.]